MDQNQMLTFITLHEVADNAAVELNGTSIVLMKRIDAYVPATKVYVVGGIELMVKETPEEISQLHMAAIADVMACVAQITQTMLEGLNDNMFGLDG